MPTLDQVIAALDRRDAAFHSQPSWHFKFEATWQDLTGKSPIWPDRRDVDVAYKKDSLFLYTSYPAPPKEKDGLKREFWSVYHQNVAADRQNKSVVLTKGFNPGGLQYNYLTDAVGLDVYRGLAPVTMNVKGWAEASQERPVLPGSLKRAGKSYSVQDRPEPVDGVDCLVVKEKSGSDTLWLDPRLGFAPRRREILAPASGKRPEIRAVLHNSGWKEDAPGVWLPREVELTHLDKGGAALRRQKVRVESVEFQELPDSFFICPIPSDCIVSDTLRKVEYTTQAPGTSPLDLASLQAQQVINSGKSPLMFLLLNGIVLACVCLGLLARYYQRSGREAGSGEHAT